MSADEHEQFRKAVLKQREIDAIKDAGLPYLRAGMSHNAVAVELRRARNRAQVRERMLKASEEEKRALQHQQPDDPAERAARAVLAALDSGEEQKRRAEAFLKTAHPRIKAKVQELVGVTSEFKQRRSNKPNGY